tara:strand:+ start:181 stop:525 length:345 start_codon:yes stop_codon:yes gene_type:complete
MPDKKLSKKIIKDSKKGAKLSPDGTGKIKPTAKNIKRLKKLSRKELKSSNLKDRKKLSKKVLKTSKKTGKIKGMAPIAQAPKSPVRSMIAGGIKNSGMRKSAKKKREALREARR